MPTNSTHDEKSKTRRQTQPHRPYKQTKGRLGVPLRDVNGQGQGHQNASQPAQLNALAYAAGSDIHIAPGQERHLPHEAWHVVQQAQGRVKPTMQMKEGVPVNDEAGLERAADAMGTKAKDELEADADCSK